MAKYVTIDVLDKENIFTACCLEPEVDWLGYISHVAGAGISSG